MAKRKSLLDQIREARLDITSLLSGRKKKKKPSSIFDRISKIALRTNNPVLNEVLKRKDLFQEQGANLGRFLQKTPDTTVNITKKADPNKPLSMGRARVGNVDVPVSQLGEKAVPFLSSLPGEVARSFGRSIERVNTERGRGEIARGVRDLATKDIPRIARNPKDVENFLNLLKNPAVETGLDAADFVPGVGVGSIGLKGMFRRGGREALEKTAKTKVIKEFEPAVKNVKGLLSSREVNTLDEFMDLVKGGKGRSAMGELGRDVHAMTVEAFGKKADTWTNKKVANAWDYVLKRLTESKRGVPIGLEIEDVSGNFAKTQVDQTFKEASDRIARQVNPKIKKTPIKDFVGSTRGFGANFKEKLVDSFSPIEDFINRYEKTVGTKLSPTSDPRLLRNRVLGAEGIGRQMLKKNLEPVLQTVGVKNLDEFDHYLAARHSLDLADRGIETGIKVADAKVFTENLASKYGQSAQAVTQHTQDVLRFVKDAGLISQSTYDDLIKRYPNYVPLNRVFDDVGDVVATPSKSVGSLGKQTVVQRIKGSTREINSPLENIVNKTMQAVDQAERNRVGRAIVDLGKKPGMEDIIKPSKKTKTFTFVDESGKTQVRRVYDRLKDNEISVLVDGKQVIYEVPEEFARAAKNLDKAHMDVLTRIAALPVRTARLGITGLNLPFIATNVVRDQLFAVLTSPKPLKTSIAHPYNFVKSFLDTGAGKGAYDDFIASGGGSSHFFAVGRGSSKPFLTDLARSKKGKIAATIKSPKKWLSTVEDLIGISEQGTRTQQFLGTRTTRGAVDPFAKPTDELLGAVKAGREHTVDFAKKGAYGNVLNSVFIYLNAGIQGSRTALRSFKTNPVATSAKLVATVYTPIAATTLWNNATEERREAYKDIPDYEKQNNIIVLPPNPKKDDKGKYAGSIKIPLPQTYLGLAVPVRSGIEHLIGSGTDKIQDVLLNTLGKISPIDLSSPGELASRMTPTAIAPVVENVTNTKLFTGQPIVPRNKEDLPPGLQSSFNTTQTMKFIGEKFNVSPAKLENLVRGYSGDVGLQVLNAVDNAMAKAGIIDEEQVGGKSIFENIVRRFTKVAGGKVNEDAFQELNKIVEEEAARKFKLKEQATQILKDIKGNPAKLQEYIKQGVFTEELQNIIKKQIEDETLDLSGQEKYLKSQSNDTKAKFILNKIRSLPPEEIGSYILDLRERKIISSNVEDLIMEQIGASSTQSRAVVPEERERINSPKPIIGGDTAPITQAFGNYNPEIEVFSDGVNLGTDFGVGEGTELSLPPGVWEVLEAYDGDGTNRGYGRSVMVQNRKTGERIRLSHMSDVLADKGEMLRGGSTIGFSGNTGNSTGPHTDVEYYDSEGRIGDILRSPYAKNL